MGWKQMTDSNSFSFQWYGAMKLMTSSIFPIFSIETCSSCLSKSIRYTCSGKTFDNVKDYFKYLKNNNKDEDNKNKLVLSFTDLNDIKYLNVFDQTTTFEFDGSWKYDFIDKVKSKDNLIRFLKDM